MIRRRILVAGIAAVLGVGGLAVGGIALAAPAPGSAPTSSPSTGVGAAAAAGGFQDPIAATAAAVPADARPTRVRIPSIGVDSGLENLTLGPAGDLQAPQDWNSAGWYSGGAIPGRVGPAVIAGHVDSPTAPAIFARLADLAPGASVEVTLSTGQVATFAVDRSMSSPKAQFPTSGVYGTTPVPELRLITCAGVFDSSVGHYVDNLIVFAHLTSVTAG